VQSLRTTTPLFYRYGRGVIKVVGWVGVVVCFVWGGGRHDAQAQSHLVKNYRETWC
jgi:hypothetical protein